MQEQVARALFNKGSRLGVLGRSEEEIAVYDDVVARFEQEPTPGVQEVVAMALVNKGLSLEARGDHDKAIEACIEALAHDPTEAIAAAAYYTRAMALFALHRWDDALQVLDDALARFPQDNDRHEAMSARKFAPVTDQYGLTAVARTRYGSFRMLRQARCLNLSGARARPGYCDVVLIHDK